MICWRNYLLVKRHSDGRLEVINTETGATEFLTETPDMSWKHEFPTVSTRTGPPLRIEEERKHRPSLPIFGRGKSSAKTKEDI